MLPLKQKIGREKLQTNKPFFDLLKNYFYKTMSVNETETENLSLKEWKDLYELAIKFKEIAPWNWMYDSDLFGVMDPENGEIGYCCVMGKAKEHYALATYQGTEGLEGYFEIARKSRIKDISADLLSSQKCLMMSFENKKYLSKEDVEMLKNLGLSFRDSQMRPQFRNYSPGYFPWYLSKKEAEFLKLAIEQAIDVALRFKDDPDLLVPPKKGLYFIRMPEKDGEKLKWKDWWLAPAPLKKKKAIADLSEHCKNRALAIKNKNFHSTGAWEVDFSLLPNAAQDKPLSRPFFPRDLFIVDSSSMFVVGVHLSGSQNYIEEFRNEFLNAIEKNSIIPETIQVRRKEVFEMLFPLLSLLGIGIKTVKNLPSLETSRREMAKFLKKQGF